MKQACVLFMNEVRKRMGGLGVTHLNELTFRWFSIRSRRIYEIKFEYPTPYTRKIWYYKRVETDLIDLFNENVEWTNFFWGENLHRLVKLWTKQYQKSFIVLFQSKLICVWLWPSVCGTVSWYPVWHKCPYSEFLWSTFSLIRNEYEEILTIVQTLYSVQMRKNMDQKNSE